MARAPTFSEQPVGARSLSRVALRSKVYAIYCREDRPDTSTIALEVFGEDTEATRRQVNSLIDEKRREQAREGGR